MKPLLFVDVDGVISLYGFEAGTELPGPFHWVDGVAHCIPPDSGPRLTRLADSYDLVWATGWEEKANEYLPAILGLPFGPLPYLNFDGRAVFGTAHWKLGTIDRYAGDRPLAWIDDHLDEACEAWAAERFAPTRLVKTAPDSGITDAHVDELLAWAGGMAV